LQYRYHHNGNAAGITVPMLDGTKSPIQHQAANDAQRTLRVITCPSGDSAGGLLQMIKKAQKWLDKLAAGRMHWHLMWVSVDCQLWPLVRYGLCCSMATLPELEACLLPLYVKMLPLGGIIIKHPRGCGNWTANFMVPVSHTQELKPR
jgi:hypothetical protein